MSIGPIIVGEFPVLLCCSCKCLYVDTVTKNLPRLKVGSIPSMDASDGLFRIFSISVSCLSVTQTHIGSGAA